MFKYFELYSEFMSKQDLFVFRWYPIKSIRFIYEMWGIGMTEYYKTGLNLYKTINNKLYVYDDNLKDWRYFTNFSRQYLLKEYEHAQLTLLDIIMLGVPE